MYFLCLTIQHNCKPTVGPNGLVCKCLVCHNCAALLVAVGEPRGQPGSGHRRELGCRALDAILLGHGGQPLDVIKGQPEPVGDALAVPRVHLVE